MKEFEQPISYFLLTIKCIKLISLFTISHSEFLDRHWIEAGFNYIDTSGLPKGMKVI